VKTTKAIDRALGEFAKASRDYAFIGMADPDYRGEIAWVYEEARECLEKTINRAIKRALHF
jgi:hypothetical protein